MKKTRAILSLEYAILLPVLLLLLLLALDIGILSYAKASAKSVLKDAMYIAYEEAYQLNNKDFNSHKAGALSLEEGVENRLKRSLFDDLYLNIDAASYEERVREALSGCFSVDKNNIEISCRFENILGFSKMELDYDVELKPLFHKLYKKAGLNICRLKGRAEIEFTNHFDAITSVDCAERMAKKNKKISDFIKKARTLIHKLSSEL